MDCKKNIAHGIIATFWSPDAADQAQQQFEALFQKKDYSQAQVVHVPSNTTNPIWIVELLKILQAIGSSSEARRLIDSGAVIIDGNVISDFKSEIQWQTGMIIKVGKHRIYRIG
jgi:tyrosyl-tRNA synthetase